MRRLLMSAFGVLCIGFISFAQTRSLSGTITGPDNKGVPSATVKVKGKSNTTITNANGEFNFQVPTGNIVLEITSVGFAERDFPVSASQSVANISLEVASAGLTEVVVTSFGIKREKKALAYSVTQLDGDRFTESRTANIGNALSGKVAGVNVSQPATGAGGSSRVLIRGGSSLAGIDQPLYVVNGIPIESSNLGSAGMWGGNDAGDGLASINPDDIESISVLKGNTASALYGARAANGVILITTKSGKSRKGVGISFNSNITFDRAVDESEFQREYGPGQDGLKPANQIDALNIGSSHWGPKLDGTSVIQFDGVSRPYSFTGEGINDFYKTGLTVNNSLAFSGGNETGNYRFSVSELDNKDIIPNATYKRQTINLNVNSKLDKFTLSVTGQYLKQDAKNRPRLSDSPGNGNFTVLMKPSTLPFSVMEGDPNKKGAMPDGYELRYQGNVYQTNPYWAAYQFFRSDQTDRIFGNVSLRYDITSWLYLQGRAGTDFQNRSNTSTEPYGTAYIPNGSYNESFQTIRQGNYDVFLGGNKRFNDFSVDVLLGGSILRSRATSKGGGGGNLVVPFFSSVTNVAAPSFSYADQAQGINSIFGSANFGYKNYLFLNVTGRQDQYSTLSADNNTLFYPSVGASFIFSDAFKLPDAISFGKLRASWAQVGGGAPSPYTLLLTYGLVGAGHLGGSLAQVNNGSIPNQALKPYTSTELEIGADIRFLKNRFGLDVAYYDRKTKNDILAANISATSGYGSTFVNIGELSNKGIELLLNANIIDQKELKWDVTVNFAKNTSKAINLGTDASGADIKQQGLDQSRLLIERIVNVVGQPLGMITGYKQMRNNKGERMYTPEGYPIRSSAYDVIAEGRHPISAGLNSGLTYKNFRLEFLIDMRQGGHMESGTNYFAYIYGLQKETLKGRNGDLKITGVLADGVTPINTTVSAANIDNYYANYAAITENIVYDASFGKLRQLSLGYTIPQRLLNKTPFESLSVSLVGRNLAVLWSKVPNVDPESGYTVNSGSQGLEFFAMPQTRSFGINIAANF